MEPNKLKDFKYNIKYFIFFLVICITGVLVKSSYSLQVLTFIGINSILALSLNILMGYAGQISLGHAAFYGIGAYTTAILTVHFNTSPWISLICAVLITVLTAFLIGLPTLKLSGYYLGMGTLGFGMILNIIFREWASFTGGASGLAGIPCLELFSISLSEPRNYFYLVWFVILISFIICSSLINSRIGRALKAIHDKENAAKAIGVNTQNLKLQVFIFSAVLCAISGFLYAHFVNFISPDSFSFLVSVKIVTMVVIGGMASVWGAILGASLLTILPDLLHAFSDFEMIIYGLILMLVMIFMPQGLTKGILDTFRKSKI